MEKDLIMTCDTGTTGCKCTLFNVKGEALFAVRRGYPTQYPHPNWAEQDPDVILEAMLDGIRELLLQVNPQRIACVGLSGTMNGCIPVDKDGMALYPNIIHSDSRTEEQVKRILQVVPFEDFYRLTGNRADTHYTLPKILWLKDNAPDAYRRARWFMNIKDYLYGSLTGRMGYTDYSDASLTIALDINRRQWATDLLGELELDVNRMPTILKGHDVRGKITRDIYRRCGLLPGTPRIFNWLDMDGEDYHVCGTVQCGAAAFDWCLKNLLGGHEGSADISIVENMARQIAPGAEGVLFLPTLMGWRTPYWDPNTRGCLMGFSLYHDQRHIARAVYEGIAFALNACAEVMAECDAPVRSLMLTGGGARSGLWPDMIAAIFGLTTQVHRSPGETTSLGAAIAAGVGVGLFNSYADAAGMVSARSTHPVNPQWQQTYKKVYAIYADIYRQIKPLNDRIAGM